MVPCIGIEAKQGEPIDNWNTRYQADESPHQQKQQRSLVPFSHNTIDIEEAYSSKPSVGKPTTGHSRRVAMMWRAGKDT